MNIKLQSNSVFAPVHAAKSRYVIMRGSAGSGKSVDTAQQYILRLMADKGRNLLCVRKSDVTNRDSTFAELQAAIFRMEVGAYWSIRQNPLMLRCCNGNEVIFRG
ncbi:MAG: phage terminase large subunit, partial [Ruthenibacterium sp.]